MVIVEMIPTGLWITEKICVGYTHSFQVDEVIYRATSKHQLIEVINHRVFGKMLFLDRKPQVAEFDEWIYHEALVHPLMLLHPSPKRVLIIGGGDGGALREVLKHECVEEVVLVDLDEEVIRVVKQYLREICRDSFEDPRVKVYYMDGRRYLEKESDSFDVIIIDVTDPCSGVSSKLFTKEFYQLCFNKLSEFGGLVTQAESTSFSHLYHEISFPTIALTVKSVFGESYPYHAFIPSFASDWGFVLASKMKGLNKRIHEDGFRDISNIETRFIDEESINSMFKLPKNLRRIIDERGYVVVDRFVDELLKRLEKTRIACEKISEDKLVD